MANVGGGDSEETLEGTIAHQVGAWLCADLEVLKAVVLAIESVLGTPPAGDEAIASGIGHPRAEDLALPRAELVLVLFRRLNEALGRQPRGYRSILELEAAAQEIVRAAEEWLRRSSGFSGGGMRRMASFVTQRMFRVLERRMSREQIKVWVEEGLIDEAHSVLGLLPDDFKVAVEHELSQQLASGNLTEKAFRAAVLSGALSNAIVDVAGRYSVSTVAVPPWLMGPSIRVEINRRVKELLERNLDEVIQFIRDLDEPVRHYVTEAVGFRRLTGAEVEVTLVGGELASGFGRAGERYPVAFYLPAVRLTGRLSGFVTAQATAPIDAQFVRLVLSLSTREYGPQGEGPWLGREIRMGVVPAVLALLYTQSVLWSPSQVECDETMSEIGRLSREAGSTLRNLREAERDATTRSVSAAAAVVESRGRVVQLEGERMRVKSHREAHGRALYSRLEEQLPDVAEGAWGPWMSLRAQELLMGRRKAETLESEKQKLEGEAGILERKRVEIEEKQKAFIQIDDKKARLEKQMDDLQGGPQFKGLERVLPWKWRAVRRKHEAAVASLKEQITHVAGEQKGVQPERNRIASEEEEVRVRFNTVQEELRTVMAKLEKELETLRRVRERCLVEALERADRGEILSNEDAADLISKIKRVDSQLGALDEQVRKESGDCSELERRQIEAQSAAASAGQARARAEERFGWLCDEPS